jgi:uncharacterized membrane protein
MTKRLRGYLFTGLVVWLPIVVTFVVISSIVEWMDQLVSLLPDEFQPSVLFGFSIPGLGVVISMIVLLSTGLLVTNLIGQKFIQLGESLLHKIPLVRVIYNTTKQIIEALLMTNGQAFRQVAMIEYPRKGCWTMAFVTGKVKCPHDVDKSETLFTVYVPTTPNPTSGFYLMLPESEIKRLDLPVEDALKVILSLGAMQQPLFKNKEYP